MNNIKETQKLNLQVITVVTVY